MSDFKAGDKLKIVDVTSMDGFEKGDIVTFKSYRNDYPASVPTDIYIEESPLSWLATRFELVKTPVKEEAEFGYAILLKGITDNFFESEADALAFVNQNLPEENVVLVVKIVDAAIFYK